MNFDPANPLTWPAEDFRLPQEGEIIEEDWQFLAMEVVNGLPWKYPTMSVGLSFYSDPLSTWRAPLWRLLSPDTRLQEGDEWWSTYDQQWIKVQEDDFGFLANGGVIFRRPVNRLFAPSTTKAPLSESDKMFSFFFGEGARPDTTKLWAAWEVD